MDGIDRENIRELGYQTLDIMPYVYRTFIKLQGRRLTRQDMRSGQNDLIVFPLDLGFDLDRPEQAAADPDPIHLALGPRQVCWSHWS